MWTREDYADTQHFVSTDSGLIRIENTYADDEEKSLLFLDGQGNTEFVQESEDGIEFEAILPARLGNIPLRKRLLYVYLNVQIERNSNLGVAVRHEGDTEFREVANISAKEKRSVLIPIKPKASSDFEISLYGKGKIALYSITREYQM